MKHFPQCIVFAGAEDMLSNWYPASFVHIDTVYTSAAQYVLYQKALFFGDGSTAERVIRTKSIAELRALGRRIKRCDEAAWRLVCPSILPHGLRAKFLQNALLRHTLLGTNTAELVFADPSDTVCGVGLAKDDPRIEDKSAWRGLNWTGIALMQLRSELQLATRPQPLAA